jgi:hypothetical protein
MSSAKDCEQSKRSNEGRHGWDLSDSWSRKRHAPRPPINPAPFLPLMWFKMIHMNTRRHIPLPIIPRRQSPYATERQHFISSCYSNKNPSRSESIHRSESSSDDADDDEDADDERDESLLEPLASRRLELCDRLLLRDRLPLRLLSPFDEAADEEDEDDDFCFFFFLRSFFSLSRSCSRSRFSRRLRFRSFRSCSSLSNAALHE